MYSVLESAGTNTKFSTCTAVPKYGRTCTGVVQLYTENRELEILWGAALVDLVADCSRLLSLTKFSTCT